MIVVDAHVHVYPGYDRAVFFRAARAALAARGRELCAAGRGEPGAHVLALAESASCRYFDVLREAAAANREAAPGVRPRPTEDPQALHIEDGGSVPLLVLEGRQVVTAERIEVLALAGDPGVPDGLPLGETVGRVLHADAVAVLSWAPGKWFFRRGRLLRAFLADADPGRVFLGDTSLRPTSWPTPRLMRTARARGFRVLAGSDPLPPPAEAARVGSYVSVLEGALDPGRPAASFRERCGDRAAPVAAAGARGGPFTVAARLAAHHREKRGG